MNKVIAIGAVLSRTVLPPLLGAAGAIAATAAPAYHTAFCAVGLS